MGRNKFEEQLREQLQGREIKPTESAWNKISEQLEVAEPLRTEPLGTGPFGTGSSKSDRFKWYGIAAGFIGILFISVLYFTLKEQSATPQMEITDGKKDGIPIQTNPKSMQEDGLMKKDALVNTGDSKENIVTDRAMEGDDVNDGGIQADAMGKEHAIGKEDTMGHAGISNKKSIPTTSRPNPDKSRVDALVSSKGEERKVTNIGIETKPSEELLNIKIAEVVAQVEILEQRNSSVTDAEIDSLLRNAQQELLEDKIFRQDRSVDAVALLADVESELDRSFRDQIFDVLKDGFLKVRTAVADRNK